ncbi:MAG: hypothetical protein ACVCEJ_06265 [Candidatus Izemoplasmataceae bacterium]
MKKSRNALGIIVLIIAGIIFGAEYFLNVNLITKFIIRNHFL